jgi:hypothetical protein
MRFFIALVFECDSADWAREHDLPQAQAATHFAALLRRAIDDGTIRQALDTISPAMRGHSNAYTTDGLDPADREELLLQLRQARDGDLDAALVDEIRQHLAAHPDELDHREPRWVIFRTEEWDNGHFLSGGDARVYFAEGDHVPVDFDGTSVDDLLTDMYGARGAMAALGVDLRTAVVEFDDYADNVAGFLGIPATGHRDADGRAI